MSSQPETDNTLSACVHGHRPTFQLQTDNGGFICLQCFIKLLEDPSTFVIHKLYAVSELHQALHYPHFCSFILQHHRHFVVAPLCQALASCKDNSSSGPLAKELMDLIIDLCKLNASINSDPVPVLQDFILHIVLQIASPSGLYPTSGQTYMLHTLGLLLDSYCRYNSIIPDAIRDNHGFFVNLLTALKLPGDHLRGEVLFLFYKMCTFEDGIPEITPFLSEMISLSLNALIKSESDELRTNCIALLSILAQEDIINIGFQQFSLGSEAAPERENTFAGLFGNAIKSSLISLDSQVQESALRLLCYMCPSGAMCVNELNELIEEGVMDYIFEVLRVSENMESIVVCAIRALSLLSEARNAFIPRFVIGYDLLIQILEGSLILPELILLIGVGVTGCPGTISTAQAERLLQALTGILKQYFGKNYPFQYDVFNLTITALAALLKLPCISRIQNVKDFLEAALSRSFDLISSYGPTGIEHEALKYATILLRDTFTLFLSSHSETDTKWLSEICEGGLIPVFVQNRECLEEETTQHVLSTFTLMVDKSDLNGAIQLAEHLVNSAWLSLSFELMARYPGSKFMVMELLATLISRLENDGVTDDVKEQFVELPADPQEMLTLLGLSGISNPKLKFVQFAIIGIIYTAVLYGERFAEETHILACFEQYLLINSATLCHDMNSSHIIKQLLYVYVCMKDTTNVQYSIDAENALVALVRHCQSNILSSKMSRNVLRWLIEQESLEEFMLTCFLNWFQTLSVTDDGTVDMIFLVTFLEEENNCAQIFNRILDEVLASQRMDEIKTVVNSYIRFIKHSASVANQLCVYGIVSNIRTWISIHSCKLSGILGSLIELLYQLLCAASCDQAIDEESWHLLATQLVHISMDKLNAISDLTPEDDLLIVLSLISLILHKCIENTGFLTQASEVILSNWQLHNAITTILHRAGTERNEISKLDITNKEGKFVSCALTFRTLSIRCAMAIHTRVQPDLDFTEYYAARVLEENFSVANSLYTAVFPKSYEEVTNVCRILYFGSQFLRVLASSCLAETFNCLRYTILRDDGTFKEDQYKDFQIFQSIVMVLEGCILDSSIAVQRNCSFCLYSLIANANLTSRERETVRCSPWLRFLLEEIVLSLSRSDLERMLAPETIYIAVATVRMSPNPTWVPFIVNPLCISAVISSLMPNKISPPIVMLLKELHNRGYLESKHLQRVQELLQVSRKIAYEESKNNVDTLESDNRHAACPENNCTQKSGDGCLTSYNHIVNVAFSYYFIPWTSRRCSTTENSYTFGLVALIDEFLKDLSSVTT